MESGVASITSVALPNISVIKFGASFIVLQNYNIFYESKNIEKSKRIFAFIEVKLFTRNRKRKCIS